MTALSAYLNAVKDIDGWFYREDAILLEAIHAIQVDHRIGGDLLEIGVYHGKTAAFLGFFRRPTERFVVCDLFSAPAANAENQAEKDAWYPGFDRQTFERRYRGVHAELPDILACDSRRLQQCAALSRSFRLIHIDGSHLYRIVRQDIRTSSNLLKPGGIMAIDDYRSAHTPGVAVAVWEAVREGRLKPICMTAQKMYATTGGRKVAWFNKLMEWSQTQTELRVTVELIGHRRILRFST
jgi:hypothetical protein